MIAALYVEAGGAYFGLDGVDPWDVSRDARNYRGPFPVVAHPPCKRWGRFWYAGGDRAPGNDGGLFAHALESVERWGGVLEHPEASHAWRAFEIARPRRGAWVRARCGWTTCVDQRNYGHRARKRTWLYACGPMPHDLDWSEPAPPEAYLCPPGRRGPGRPGDTTVQRLTPRENAATPPAFRDVLIRIAKNSNPRKDETKCQANLRKRKPVWREPKT